MRLLLVCYCFPPDLNPRAFRWGALAQYWAEQGHEVDVVCGPQGKGPTQDRLRTHAVGLGFAAAAARSLRESTTPKPDGVAVNQVSRLGTRALRSLRSLRNLTWNNVYWPDYACLWYFAAKRRVITLLENNDYDAVVTISNPYSCHLVGLLIRRRRPDIRWIADIGDPFSTSVGPAVNNTSLYGRKNEQLERDVLRRADAVTVTNGVTAADYAAAFPEFAAKLQVIPPLHSAVEAADANDALFTGDARRIVFTGRLYRDLRSPEAFLTAFLRLIQRPEHARTEVHFFGVFDECRSVFDEHRDLLGSRVFLHGEVSRPTALKAVRQADVLLNLGNSTRNQLPSKLVDYIASGRPIVDFSSNSDNCSLEFLSQYPNHLHVTPEQLSDEAKFVEFARFVADARPIAEDGAIDRILGPYRLPSIAGAYEATFDVAVARHPA